MMSAISSEMLTPEVSGLMDGLLLLVLLGVWGLWWKQSRRSQRVEQSLLEAAAQLQEATTMLDDALSQIALLQQHEATKQEEVAPKKERFREASKRSMRMADEQPSMDDDMDFPSQARASLDHGRREIHAVGAYEEAQSPSSYAPEAGKRVGTMDVARILRMQREGQSLESIASTLDIPLAQVKLMLMLQKGVA